MNHRALPQGRAEVVPDAALLGGAATYTAHRLHLADADRADAGEGPLPGPPGAMDLTSVLAPVRGCPMGRLS
jgi:hypothetical protein